MSEIDIKWSHNIYGCLSVNFSSSIKCPINVVGPTLCVYLSPTLVSRVNSRGSKSPKTYAPKTKFKKKMRHSLSELIYITKGKSILIHLSKLCHFPLLALLFSFLPIIPAASTMHFSHFFKTLKISFKGISDLNKISKAYKQQKASTVTK